MKPIVKTLAAGPLFVLAACAQTDPSVGFADPYENGNRKMHEFNKGLDTTVIRPVATAYGTVLPRPIRQGVSNIASNLGEPGNVVNNVLQGRVEDALHNTTRFLFNSTIGIAGTFDVASAMGLEERETDFGETLHVWGAQEGAYLEVPFVGPSTERDAIGKAVDIVLNPIDTMFHKDVSTVQAATNVGSRLGDRHDFSNTIDSTLYESADSYAQTRLTYLQNRRYRLRNGVAEEEYFDPYEDPYAQ